MPLVTPIGIAVVKLTRGMGRNEVVDRAGNEDTESGVAKGKKDDEEDALSPGTTGTSVCHRTPDAPAVGTKMEELVELRSGYGMSEGAGKPRVTLPLLLLLLLLLLPLLLLLLLLFPIAPAEVRSVNRI